MSEQPEPYDTEPIGDILDRVMTPEGQQSIIDQERSFRRGYVHGYEAAIDDIETMLQQGVEPLLILNRMVTHSEGAVATWRRLVHDTDDNPPRLS